MVDLPKKKVGIVACSGEELAEGTVTRLAALKVLEQLRPNDTVTICLPLFLAGGQGDRAFARFYPTIAVDGCAERCAARSTELYSGKPAASLVVSDLVAENHLEKTLFKSGFSGARQDKKGFMAYHISTPNKIRMLMYYFEQFLLNPAYLNSSMIDTVGSFISYYGIKHDYINFFNFIKWDEQIITKVLINDYEWETDPETNSTWRIGDGTAAFYNYIYYMVAGFNENDTFRSNQIREGNLNRDEALKLTNNENTPRWDSIQWYCNTIGIDFEKTICKINSITPFYE